MFCKLGQSVGRAVTAEATIALWLFDSEKLREISVVLGERSKETNGINSLSMIHRDRLFRFGRRLLLMMRGCRAEKTSKDKTPRVPKS